MIIQPIYRVCEIFFSFIFRHVTNPATVAYFYINLFEAEISLAPRLMYYEGELLHRHSLRFIKTQMIVRSHIVVLQRWKAIHTVFLTHTRFAIYRTIYEI